MVPDTASSGATIERLEPGHVVVRLRDRRAVRNHLRSVHAIALTNVGELSTGLALLGAMPPAVRGILVGIETDYLKKARGTLYAEARCEVPEVTGPEDCSVRADVRDEAGDVVAVVRAAGGEPEHLVRLTIYVTDKDLYRAATRAVGEAYRAVVGRHYPAMALVQVAALLEEGALVEIEATAALP